MTTYGVHAGLQKVPASELIELYRRIEDLGYGWISVWDHFYAADMTGDAECLEAVSMHAALALSTSKVRCGSLVYSVGYRHPAVLANAIATIDNLSGGRTDVGDRRGLEPDGVRRVRHPVPLGRHPHGPARGGHPGPARAAARRGHHVRGTVVPAARRAERAPTGPGQAADLGRRWWREAHVAHRGPVRGRMERPVHLARGVRTQARRPAPALRGRRARSRARSAAR